MYILVNFGGPRSLKEVSSFLQELLTDQDIIDTGWPAWWHRLFFSWVAKKRAKKVVHDYALIGGRSPIYEDTEAIATQLSSKLGKPVIPFHRYLRQTHKGFLKEVSCYWKGDEVRVLPMFPQFSYTTTGSVARWFSQHLPRGCVEQLRWVRSYPEHVAFVGAFQRGIQECLENYNCNEEETLFLYSAHGLPLRYVQQGDPYREECVASFEAIAKGFPKGSHQLCYQSLFGKEEWLRPYMADFCAALPMGVYQNVMVVPLSFTSDHIETLFEIEQQYLPVLKERKVMAIRCPALNQREDWIEGLVEILKTGEWIRNEKLYRV